MTTRVCPHALLHFTRVLGFELSSSCLDIKHIPICYPPPPQSLSCICDGNHTTYLKPKGRSPWENTWCYQMHLKLSHLCGSFCGVPLPPKLPSHWRLALEISQVGWWENPEISLLPWNRELKQNFFCRKIILGYLEKQIQLPISLWQGGRKKQKGMGCALGLESGERNPLGSRKSTQNPQSIQKEPHSINLF